jgi:hypothetical protein
VSEGDGDGDAASGRAAAALVGAGGLAIVAALISGLTLDLGSGDGGSVELRYRLKVIALSSSSIAFFGPVLAGAFVVGLALLFALALANSAPPGPARAVRNATMVVAGLLTLATLGAVMVDLTFLAGDDFHASSVVAFIVADLASLLVCGAAAATSLSTARAVG